MKRISIISSICLLLVLVPLLSTAALSAETRDFAPVQKGFVTRGQTVAPYATDRIMVRFSKTSLETSRMKISFQMGAEVPGAVTGIPTVDALNREVGAIRIFRPYMEPKNKAEAVRLGVDRWFIVELPDGSNIEDVVARYASDPNVEYAKPDYIAFPAVVPGDPLYADHWGHNNTAQLPSYDWSTHTQTGPLVGTVGFDANAEAAWDASQGFGSSSIIIAILDSGVDIDHPDLNLVSGYDFGDGDSNPDDNASGAGHGTCCAGVAASLTNSIGACGIAPACRIMPCKVANSAGTMYFSYIENAIIWAADNGADIISMSLGAAGVTSDPGTDAAIQYAYNAGCVILAATGNENDNAISYPAINAYVIGVGAASPCGDRKRSSSLSSECNPGVNTDPNGYTCDGQRWWGSNYGTNLADAAGAVDVIAPTIVPTTDIGGSGGYQSGDYEPFFNGTSCSTPYAAGVCALIKSANPTWTAAQIRDQLCNTAIDIVNVESGSGWDRYSGYGMVDAEAAVGGGGPVAPVAEFVGSPTSGTEPLTVNFTDQSTNSPTSWSWTFGDGGSSSQQNPNYTYMSAGIYTVSLTATNAAGSDGETKTNYITVNACVPPTAAFVGSPTSGDAPLTVNFTDQSTGADSWSWDFGDGGTSTSQSPNHTYTTDGTYTVALTVSNSCGSDDEIKVGYITVTMPTIDYANLPYTTGFESGALDNYWATTIGVEGRIRILSTNTPHSGTYHLVMDDHTNGGSYSQNEAWLRLNLAGKSDVDLDFWWKEFGDETHTQDGIFFSDNGGASFTKVLDLPGASYTNNTWTEFNLDLDALAASAGLSLTGTFVVKFQQYDNYGITTDGFAFDDISVTEIAPLPPVAAFSGAPTSGTVPLEVTFTDQSTGAPTSWSWTFGDGGTSTAQNPVHTYNAVGTYTVTLTATNAVGSDGETKTNYITVQEVGDGYAALPYTTGFETGALDEYWLTTLGAEGRILISTANTPHSGAYHLVMDDHTNGGSYSQNEAWLHLNLAGKGDVNLDFWWKEFGDETHTQDGIFFSDDGGNSFTKVHDLPGASYTNNTWTEFNLDLDALAATAGLNLTATFVVKFQQYDNYGVTTDGFAFDDISVTEDAPQAPVAEFAGSPTSGNVPLTVNFTDQSTGSPTSWSWTFGDGGMSTAQNPSHEYTAIGTYTVTLTVDNAIGSDSETKTDYITVTEGGGWTVITYDDFESGWGSYADGGGDCSRYTGGTYAHQGSAALDIQDNSGTSSSFYHSTGYNVSGYTTLEVEFWFMAVSMDNANEDFWVQYYDGSTWHTVATYARTTDFDNNVFYNKVVTISSASYNFPTNARLRFMCDASGNRDDVYIDEIEWRGTSGGTSGGDEPVLADEEPVMPEVFSLGQNYPNPFNPATTISFNLTETAQVRLEIFNVAGQKVATLLNETRTAGEHKVVFNASSLSSGIYLYRLIAGDKMDYKKMILLR